MEGGWLEFVVPAAVTQYPWDVPTLKIIRGLRAKPPWTRHGTLDHDVHFQWTHRGAQPSAVVKGCQSPGISLGHGLAEVPWSIYAEHWRIVTGGQEGRDFRRGSYRMWYET